MSDTPGSAAFVTMEDLEKYGADLSDQIMSQGVMPIVDSKFGLVFAIMRYMFVKAGNMTSEEFNGAFGEYMEEFMNLYGAEELSEEAVS